MFKRGIKYKRDEIATIVRPDSPPYGGDWTTGYARIENDLYVLMNIGIPGQTGHQKNKLCALNFWSHSGHNKESKHGQMDQ